MSGNSYLTLSAFQSILAETLHRNPLLQGAWITAELSDVRIAGGHCYMELIEKDAQGTTRAKMRATIWSSTLSRLNAKFYHATGRSISSGIKVMVRGSASHHAVYGLSLNIIDIDPSYTLGDMERLRREILERLTREGIADRNKELPTPVLPQKIAVISAEGAAGYGDFMNQIATNARGIKTYTLLYPAVMQGDRTSESVRNALALIEMAPDFWDCVVIIRGGGATTDLNGFDDYALARAVALCPIPVVVGIGHERDRTVLDEIANVRCKTPTAVAAWVIDTLRGACDSMIERAGQVVRYTTEALAGEQRRIESLRSMVPTLARNILLGARMRLQNQVSRMPVASARITAYAATRLQTTTGRIGSAAARCLDTRRYQLERTGDKLANLLTARLALDKQRVERYESLVRALSPANTLRRGYSITRIEDHAVHSASEIVPGLRITTLFADGKIESTVDKIEAETDGNNTHTHS